MALKFYSGWIKLSGDFPPSLNNSDDSIRLKPGESPSVYGVDPDADGLLKSGSVPTGTARTAPVGTGGYTAWNYYYDRLWLATGSNLKMGAPHYRNTYLRQGSSRFDVDATIVTFMPCLEASLWIATGSGSQFLQRVNDGRAYYELTPMRQELWVAAANRCITLDGKPFVCNSSGVFSYNGDETKEWTAAVRDSLGSFANQPILAEYSKKYIIGTSKFVIDTNNGKLFDFGTAGFRFTSRTLTSEGEFNPFEVISIAFILSQTGDGGTISWQTKMEDNDWTDEDDIEVEAEQEQYTRIERETGQTSRMCRRFAMRITSLSSNISIREIQVNVSNMAQGAFTE